MSIEQYAIAAGNNVALGSLVNIETIKPGGDTHYFYAPKAIGFYDPGQPNVRGDGLYSFNGFASVMWRFLVMTRLQLAYARTTWCNGGWSGPVTIYTTTGGVTYARYNANLLISLPNTFDGSFFANKDVKLAFTGLVAL